MFYKLDASIYARVGRFCHWWQRLTGLTNFWVANKLLILVPIGYASSLIAQPTQDVSRPVYYGIWVMMVVVSAQLVLIEIRRNIQMEEYYLSGSETMHPFTLLRLTRVFGRLAMGYLGSLLAMAAVFGAHDSFLNGVLAASLFSRSLADYCGAWVPLPPGKSRVRQWVESIGTMFRKPQVAYAPASR